jgi:hypothetical protein
MASDSLLDMLIDDRYRTDANRPTIIGIAPLIGTVVLGGLGSGFTPGTLDWETSDSEHWTSMVQGLQLFLESPLFGSGLGIYIYGQLKQFGKPLLIHSSAIWLLAETGLVGFLAFAVPFARILAVEWQRRKMGDFGGQLVVMTLVAFAVTSMVHELLYQRPIWLLLGAGLKKQATGIACLS